MTTPLTTAIVTNPITVSPDMLLAQVITLIEENQCKFDSQFSQNIGQNQSLADSLRTECILVLDQGRPVGYLRTDRIAQLQNTLSAETQPTIASMMQPNAIVFYESECDDLWSVFRQFHRHNVWAAFVLNVNDHVVGLITQSSLRHALETLPSAILYESAVTAQLQIYEHEDQLEDLLENATDLIQSVRLDNAKFEYVNRVWRETLGYSQAEVQDLSLFDVLHPDCRSHCQEIVQDMLNGKLKKLANIELIFRHKDQHNILVEGNVNCHYKNGYPVSTRAIFRDITERKAIDLQVRQADSFRQKILDTMAEGLCVYHTIPVFPFVEFSVWNQQMKVITGYTHEEINRLGWYQSLYPDPEHQAQVIARMDQIHQGNNLQNEKWQIQHQNGSLRSISITTSVLHDSNNQINILALIQDITEREYFEIENHNTLQELSAFKLGLDQSAIVAIVNTSGIITYCNDQFCTISGYSRDELIGQTHRIVNSGYHPKSFFKNLWTTIVRGEIWRGEICNRTKDGSLYWVNSTIVPFFNDQGLPSQYLAVRFDITARKQAEVALAIAIEDMQKIIHDLEVAQKNKQAIIRELESTQSRVEKSNALLNVISSAQSQFITAANRLSIFEQLLEALIDLTDSEYGFIGEVLFKDNGSASVEEGFLKVRGVPYLNTHSITNIAWDEETQKFYEENYTKGMRFTNMQTLFGVTIMTGQPVIANNPQEDPRSGGLPSGHPPLNTFLGLPFFSGSNLIGMVGLANRPHGYNQDMITYLQPFLLTCSNLVEGYRLERQRLAAENARQVAERTAAQRLASIEAAIDGIAILQDQTYIYLNQAHVKLFGYDSPDQLLGQHWRCLYDHDVFQKVEQDILPLLVRDRAWQGEVIATRRDGCVFDEGLSLTLTEEGLIICVCRDISDRKQAEMELQRTNQELARATRLKDEFLANMSHELRTPLNAILGITEGLLDEVFGSINEKQGKYLKTIERSGSHLLALINDILDVAKIGSGQIDLSYTPTCITTLCNSSVSLIQTQARKKKIQVETIIPPDLPDIWLDERRIQQVLINLLTNAVKFTPDGGNVTLEVTSLSLTQITEECRNIDFGQEPSPWFLRMTVTDTGIGIEPENIHKLFQPFMQIDSALNRQYMGTGLGLALVKQIVKLHGGVVDLESTVDVGSCFAVYLPYQRELEQKSGNSDSKSFQDRLLSDQSNVFLPRILLAEDNEANIETLQAYLQARGYEVILAGDGAEAIAAAQRETPDLILMDIQMPKVDGLEAIQQIRALPGFAEVPIIALTALAMSNDRDRCLAAGATNYLAKPVKLKKLDLMIRTLLTST